MSSALPYMQLYVADYLGDTFDLSTEEHGIYLILLMLTWRRGGSLPNDFDYLRKAINSCATPIHGNHFNRLVPALLKRFFQQDSDGNWANKRLGKELEKAKKRSGTAQQSANKRWAQPKKNNGLSDADAMLYRLRTDTDSEQIREEQKKESSLRELKKNGASAPSHSELSQPKKLGTRLPDEWQPLDEDWDKAKADGLTDDELKYENAQFKAHWLAKSGKDATKLDWDMTWQKWMRKAAHDKREKQQREASWNARFEQRRH